MPTKRTAEALHQVIDARLETTRSSDSLSISTQHIRTAAFGVLVVQSFQRHWRVRQMGWVSFGLLAIVVGWVAGGDRQPGGLGSARTGALRGGVRRTGSTPSKLLPNQQYFERDYDDQKARAARALARRRPRSTRSRDAIQTPILSIPHAVLSPRSSSRTGAYMNFSRWVVLGAFLGFVLPLFTLSYASAAFGTERESRSLVWLMTRPIPAVGDLPGEVPRHAAVVPGVRAGRVRGAVPGGGRYGRGRWRCTGRRRRSATVAFAALFHLIGAMFRRPVVVGLVYVFFFEALVGGLPGSLKLLSLTFYARCLMYNAAAAAGYPAEMLDVPQAVSSHDRVGGAGRRDRRLTVLGMWLFARSEYRDDV